MGGDGKQIEFPREEGDPSDAELFEEVMPAAEHDQVWSFEKAVAQMATSGNIDDVQFARQEAATFRRVAERFIEIAEQRDPALTELQAVSLEDAAVNLRTDVFEIIDFEIEDPGRKGDLLFAVVDLMLATFDIGQNGVTTGHASSLERLKKLRSDMGRHGSQQSVAARKKNVEDRRSWILTVSQSSVEETERQFSPEKLAGNIEEMEWPSHIQKREFSTILTDLRKLIQRGDLSLKK